MTYQLVDVCAGWLPGDPVIGQCYVDRTRGSEVISFSYDKSWLSQHSNIWLDPDLSLSTGRQYLSGKKPMFGFLSDCAPDRWGRKLMDRREILDAKAENRTRHKLLESDYLFGVHDGGRQGGLRFRDLKGTYVSARDDLAAPPITELRKLEHASQMVEAGGQDEPQWLKTILAPGSSLGGARPKANVIDQDQTLWIAKFPSKTDTMNAGAWEMVIHDLAFLCGLNVPDARLEHLSGQYDTFLVKRFDRYKDKDLLKRKHFVSAMTVLGETDGSSELHSYLELVSFIEEQGIHVEQDCKELWKRIVFNLCITNADDHLRNHGFLLEDGGWVLSPAYDINPDYEQTSLSLAIDFDDPDRDLRIALDAADYYRVSRSEALNYIQTVQRTIKKRWSALARHYKISREEQTIMAPAFTECERDI